MKEDPYMRMFLRDFCLRESCYQCTIKENGSVSDITIGDFWGVKKVIKDIDDSMGVSLVLIHSEKGKQIFEASKADMRTFPVDYDKATEGNAASLYRSVKKPQERNSFFSDMHKMSWSKLSRKDAGDKFSTVVKRKLLASKAGQIYKSRKYPNGEKQKSFEYGLLVEFEKGK